VEPSISVKRKVTVPVGRLGKGGLHKGQDGPRVNTGDIRQGALPLLECRIGHQGTRRTSAVGVVFGSSAVKKWNGFLTGRSEGARGNEIPRQAV
jgi:hypothetical protein